MDKFAEYLEQREKFRNLTLDEQIDFLEKSTDKNDIVIGEIYINRIFLELKDREQNKRTLSNLFEKATIVKDYGSMGMGDVEYRWILAVRNLLIGVFGISNYGGPLLVGGNYKVYRFDKTQKTTDLDIEKIEPLLFK